MPEFGRITSFANQLTMLIRYWCSIETTTANFVLQKCVLRDWTKINIHVEGLTRGNAGLVDAVKVLGDPALNVPMGGHDCQDLFPMDAYTSGFTNRLITPFLRIRTDCRKRVLHQLGSWE